jgi:hypothetical protein
MELVLDIDGKLREQDISSDRIILTTNYSLIRNSPSVFLIKKSLVDDFPYVADAINRLFADFPEAFSPIRNGFYMRIMRPIFSVIYQIELLMEGQKIDHILLIGGSEFPFLTMFGGEGEGENWMFKPSWLYNYFVYKYFKNTIRISWTNKRLYSSLRIFHFLRENVIQLKFYKRLFINIGNSNSIRSIKKFKYILFTSGPLQYNHIVRTLGFINFEQALFVNPSGYSSYENHNELYHQYRFSDYVYALKAWHRETKNISAEGLNMMIFKKEISINKGILLMAFKLSFVEYYMDFNSMYRLLSEVSMESKPIFISNRTFGEDIILVNNLAKSFYGSHFNYQPVAMSIMWYPQIKLADKYYMYTKLSWDFYRKLDLSYKYYLPTYNMEEVTELKRANFLTVSIFTQPDSLTPRYLKLLSDLDKIIKENPVENILFKIKPHYRQNDIKSFEKIISESNCFELVDISVKPSELLEQSDFALSMTSSVLFEAVQFNCPGIVFDLNGINESFVEINCVPEVNFVLHNYDELLSILRDPIQYKIKYSERRRLFLAKDASTNYIDEFICV